MQECQFDAVDLIKARVAPFSIGAAEASLRWVAHHGQLTEGDAIIIGASSIDHLKENVDSARGDHLPEDVVLAFDEAWELCKDKCPNYSRGYSGSSLASSEKI